MEAQGPPIAAVELHWCSCWPQSDPRGGECCCDAQAHHQRVGARADLMLSSLIQQLCTWGLHTSCLPPTAASACTALPAADLAAQPLGLPGPRGLPALRVASAACSSCPGAAAWVPASALAAAPLPVPVVASLAAPMTTTSAAPLPLVYRQQLGPQAGACSCGGVPPFLWCGLRRAVHQPNSWTAC